MILDLVVRPPGQALGDLRPAVAQLPVLLAHYVFFFLGPFAFPDGRICYSKRAGSIDTDRNVHRQRQSLRTVCHMLRFIYLNVCAEAHWLRLHRIWIRLHRVLAT